MRRLLVVLSLIVVAFDGSPARADADSACADLAVARSETVIVLTPPSEFTICRRGRAQQDVVTGRPVWLVVRPSATRDAYEYRIHGRDEEPTASGLALWQARASALAKTLTGLSESAEAISEMPPMAAVPAEQRAVATSRALYLGVATPRFHETLRTLASELPDVPAVAAALKRWCDHLGGETGLPTELETAVRSACADPALSVAAVQGAATDLEKAIREYHVRRTEARDALVMALATPSDRAAQEAAVRSLDAARAAARATVNHAVAMVPLARGMARAATIEREAIHSGGLLKPGVAVYLAKYSHGGNGALQIDVRPKGVIDEGVTAAAADTHMITYRFSIVATHYVDLELGLGITGGLPLIPSLGTVNGMAVLQGRQVDEFVALAFVELEPLRLWWPDKGWAGLLRLPVLGIPLSRDPTENFFIGAGIGWTGVGSITAGPYLLRELTLRNGFAFDQPLPAGASFSAVTHPEVQVGYFIAASVDLLGLFHLFVPVRQRTVDATTGKEL